MQVGVGSFLFHPKKHKKNLKKSYVFDTSPWVEIILIIAALTAIKRTHTVLSDFWCIIALNLHEADVCGNVKR